jgi:hypothetical protein
LEPRVILEINGDQTISSLSKTSPCVILTL